MDKIKTKQRNTTGTWASRALFIVLGTVLAIYAFVLLWMLFWGVLTSLKSEADYLGDKGFIAAGPNLLGFPRADKNTLGNSFKELFTLRNYRMFMSKMSVTGKVSYYKTGASEPVIYQVVNSFGMMLGNTMAYTIGGALIYAFMPALTAYLCAKYDYKLSRAIVVVYTLMMCMPIVGNLPTELTFLRDVGLYDSILGNYVQKMTGSGMYFFVYLAYFKGTSNTYKEAATIDGAGPVTVMFRIYFPLAIKMMSTVFLIQFVNLWNDYQTPLVYMPTWPTLAYGIFYLSKLVMDRDFYSITVQIAGPMILAIPIVIIFILFKDKLMGNITLGGIKE